MKKTLTVNLGGTVFNIDDDAYRLLDNYLSNLKIHFRKEAGADEIVDYERPGPEHGPFFLFLYLSCIA